MAITKTNQKDKIWVCDRCEITVENKHKEVCMCPCPRGGCEAEQVSVPAKLYTKAEVLKIINSTMKERSMGLTRLINHFS